MISCQKVFCLPCSDGLPAPRGFLVYDGGASKLLSSGGFKSSARVSRSLVAEFAIADKLALTKVSPGVNTVKTASSERY